MEDWQVGLLLVDGEVSRATGRNSLFSYKVVCKERSQSAREQISVR